MSATRSDLLKTIKSKKILLWSLGVWVACFIYFGAIFILHVESDLQDHARSIRDFVNGNTLPPANFLFYLIVYILAFFNTADAPLFLASSLVLAFAVLAKFIVTRNQVEHSLQQILPSKAISGTLILCLSLLMLVVFNLPPLTLFSGGRFYLGQIPPNVWHNSTTIFLMPFALLLFFKSFQQLENPTSKGIWVLLGLCILNILAKPNYFFVFCLVFPLMLLRNFGLNKTFWLNLIPVVVGGILVVLEYYLIYKLSFGNLDDSASSITIAPFSVWKIFTTNIPVSLLVSVIFPLAYMGLYWRDLKENRLVQYSILSYLAGLAIFCLLSETGPRIWHGNFFWQTVVCSYFLFLVLLIQFIKKVREFGLHTWQNRLILVTFSFHVISGLLFMGLFLINRSYFI